ncbi:MAG: AI-2E family transporter [Phycisphaerae bacterium]|nr:AI-2E family transporter [Phycisphaerae bacterium]
MSNNDTEYTFDRVVRVLLTACAIVAVFALLRYLADVLIPFAAAVVLAYLLNPVVTKIEDRTKRRWLAVASVLVGLGILGLVMCMVLVPLVGSQLHRFERSLETFAKALPQSTDSGTPQTQPAVAGSATASRPAGDEKTASGLTELLDGWGEFQRTKTDLPYEARMRLLASRVDGTLVGAVMRDAASFVRTQKFREMLLDALKQLAVGGFTLINVAVDLVLGATVLLVVLIYLVFLLLDFNEYARTSKELLPSRYRDSILGFLQEFEVAMRRYFRGQFVVALSVGILFSIGFSIVGLPMAVPLGLFIGLLNMVPYLQIVALIPAGLLALLRSIETGSSVLVSLALVLAVFAVVQVLQDAIIVPRVMGKATGLRPVSILLGVFVWGKLLGFFGLLLAIPLTCLGIAYYRRHVLTSRLATEPSSIERP